VRPSVQATQLRLLGNDLQTSVDHARLRASRGEDLNQRRGMARRDSDRETEAPTGGDRNASIK